jgi:hypothetical protein
MRVFPCCTTGLEEETSLPSGRCLGDANRTRALQPTFMQSQLYAQLRLWIGVCASSESPVRLHEIFLSTTYPLVAKESAERPSLGISS